MLLYVHCVFSDKRLGYPKRKVPAHTDAFTVCSRLKTYAFQPEFTHLCGIRLTCPLGRWRRRTAAAFPGTRWLAPAAGYITHRMLIRGPPRLCR
jgi:hypothetical protein